MKAAIFYDQIALALRTSNLLQSVGPKKEFKIHWDIDFCHTGILRFPSVADEALRLTADADLIVFSGCSANSLRPWTIQWLERWASSRLNEHSILALADAEISDICPPVDAFVLSEFARRHNIGFVAWGNDIRRHIQSLSSRGPRTVGILNRHSRLQDRSDSVLSEGCERSAIGSCWQEAVLPLDEHGR